jgi:hypothetical protein
MEKLITPPEQYFLPRLRLLPHQKRKPEKSGGLTTK